ncbi:MULTISPECIES: DUF2163 domain-containing protein [Rhodobacterales]|jgi:uncharacterized phage protein (TIGR02218 family)|uniref:DUF2163 domain-containing protein n=1 Tax=Rhodobacterales TaxID=204455 RepID=UPI00237F0BA6|nr:DUF2163 domain-containing protein [Phaeobacter gallaeciensis]MDE4139508.1 DUF2163 domain-containing protein [Phaeobacter gallaeciensis]MDE4147434.1 DUF2163 domain-containing protein [Phaeobacter gallaeciensis]MDE4151653.1 DUF2163 domain-containing protein [Phaeobacter gallaeciensis]MDE4227563.1 DUF2163 domain-containing protein [Phaeobacter gallaeciensis]MDE4256117.1 DUF2163 domain-containing protein [Phaeobacter gallaeciensis]
MAGPSQPFLEHLATGVTTLCRAWGLTCRDGEFFGFTDHDCDLAFDGMTFKAGSGLTARALQQATGLSVDNTEALGALSDTTLRAEDIEAGRFDAADMRCWLVNWQDLSLRWLQFRGSIGELRRAGSAFEAELRGLSEALNRPLGRVYQKPCSAVLGDDTCRFDLDLPGYSETRLVECNEEGRLFYWKDLAGFEPDWFTRGRLTVLTGTAEGLWSAIKQDRSDATGRLIELWEPLRAPVAPGDLLRLDAGCDKRMETCRFKFNNLINFQGFPDIPGEDWVMSVPRSTGANTGGSRR